MGARASICMWPFADIQYGFLDRELGYDNLHVLAAQGRHKAVRAMMRKGMNPNARRLEGALGADEDERGDSPMICAARGFLGNKDRPGHVKTLEVLLHFGARVNQPNLLGQTPLYVACEHNLLLVATWLVQHVADVNINCKVGVSPLMCAYQNKNAALVKLLLDKGAVVIRPPATFSWIKFPELSDELETPETPTPDKEEAQLHDCLQEYIDREAERRARLLADASEDQRLEDQRVYRQQLTREGAKRKARRRQQRQVAQNRRHLPPVTALASAAADSSETHRDDNDRASTQGEEHNYSEELLFWEKKAVVPRARTARGVRPTWAARQIHCTQQHRAVSEHDFMRQCDKLYASLQQQQERRSNWSR